MSSGYTKENHPDNSTLTLQVIGARNLPVELRHAISSSPCITIIGDTAPGTVATLGAAPGAELILYCGSADDPDEIARAVRALAEKFRKSKLVLLSKSYGRHSADLADSIAGIVMAHYSIDQLLLCLRLIKSGIAFFPHDLWALSSNSPVEIESADRKLALLMSMLTPRQYEVLNYVALGKSNKYIATELSLCESTVKVHVHELMKRLGASSRTHASYLFNTASEVEVAEVEEAAS